MRLDKYITEVENYTRSEAKNLIKKGQVSVNGVLQKKDDYKVDENHDLVTIAGKEYRYKEFYYYLLHKPAGVITACEDKKEKTVMDLLNGAPGKNLSPVGRLDKDTEGFLLITNDGALSHNLLSPKKHVAKTYYTELKYSIDDEAIAKLKAGVDIGDEEMTLPAKVKKVKENAILLTITEGRFHQVKRMLVAVKNEVTYLKRVSMGNLSLPDDLLKGTYRELTEEELILLKENKNDDEQ